MKINNRTTKTLLAREVSSRFNVSKELWEINNITPEEVSYVLERGSYNYAQMDSEVTVPSDGILSFYMLPPTDTSNNYILRSSTGGAYLFYRASDGRFRLSTDDDNLMTFTLLNLPTNTPTAIMVILIDNGAKLYVNGNLHQEVTGGHSSVTVDQIGEGVSVFGMTLANQVSYPMRSLTPSTNTLDMIGNNNLTYIDLKDPLTVSDFLEVSGDY